MLYYLIIFLLTFVLKANGAQPSYTWSTRQLVCINHGLNISRCSLKQPGYEVELNPGCFEETDNRNSTKIYCRLNCEEADDASIVQKLPAWNHHCSTQFTYHLERRRQDWYIWRSGDCISTTITIEANCGFPTDPRVFYAQNKQLFEYEDSKN